MKIKIWNFFNQDQCAAIKRAPSERKRLWYRAKVIGRGSGNGSWRFVRNCRRARLGLTNKYLKVIRYRFLIRNIASLKYYESKLWPKHITSWSGASSKANENYKRIIHCFCSSFSSDWTWNCYLEISDYWGTLKNPVYFSISVNRIFHALIYF